MKELAGRVAFITGGGSGIGFGIAKCAAEAGMKVAIADVRPDHLEQGLAKLRAAGAHAHGMLVDVADAAAVERAAEETIKIFGKVHLVCNNAGVSIFGPMDAATMDDWRWIMGVNVDGVINGIQSFMPRLKAHGEGGHIVNTASMAGMINGMGFSPYAASKFAVVGMSEGLAAQLKPLGIGVSVLCPDFVRTGIGESGRNRPQRYGVTQPLDPASPAATMVAEIATRLQAGLDPAAVAARVLGAISNDELYVFTHPNMRTGVDERFAAIQAAMDKVAD